MFTSLVHFLEAFLNVAVDIETMEVAFQPLRNCFGFCKIGYLFLAVLPSCATDGAIVFDRMMERGVRTLARGVFDFEKFRELPTTSQIQRERNSLVLRFTSAKDIPDDAFLTSSSAANILCEKTFAGHRKGSHNIRRHPWSLSLILILPTVNDSSVQCLLLKKTPLQKILTEVVHEAMQDGIPLGDEMRQFFRALIALPGCWRVSGSLFMRRKMFLW